MPRKLISACSASVDASYIAAALGISKVAVQKRADKGAWRYAEVKGRGGAIRMYQLRNLPLEARTAIIGAEIFALIEHAEQLRRTAAQYERAASFLSKRFQKQQGPKA